MGELLFGFGGRIGRSGFWTGQLVVLGLGWLYFDNVDSALATWIPGSIYMGSAIALLLALPLIWIQAAITIKRCHDRGKTGFWLLLLFVPPLGLPWLLVDCGLLPGTPALQRRA